MKSYLLPAISLLGACLAAAAAEPQLHFKVTPLSDAPVIDQDHPGAKGNKTGFEGGSVVKLDGEYHLFVSEMYNDPFAEAMRLAHWTSPDALHWKRAATLYETKPGDKGPRAALWAPMPIFNRKENRWNLFYVAYGTPGNQEGRIWRAVSENAGPGGIGGPYKDVEIILQRGPQSQPWEGPQGTDSFYPYRAGDRWLGWYGSWENDKAHWRVGLVEAPDLAGPWRRLPTGNPVLFEPVFAENPIVTKVGDLYMAVYDSDVVNVTAGYHREAHSIGVTWSRDGVHWVRGTHLQVQPAGPANWSKDIRTPLGLVPEGKNVFTLLYTGERRDRRFFPVGAVRIEILRK